MGPEQGQTDREQVAYSDEEGRRDISWTAGRRPVAQLAAASKGLLQAARLEHYAPHCCFDGVAVEDSTRVIDK